MTTGIESEVRSAAAEGQIFDGRSPSGARRSVPAELIYDLCVTSADVHARGVRLLGVNIDDDVMSFEGATLRVPLRLNECRIRSAVILEQASAPSISIERCFLEQDIRADQFSTKHGFSLECSTVLGTASMIGFETDGQLSLYGANVLGRMPESGDSIVADSCRIRGSLIMSSGMVLAGGLRLPGTVVEGDIDLDGSAILAPNDAGDAVLATGLEVRGRAVLRDGFRAVGTLWFAGANMGELSFRDARLSQAQVSVTNAHAALFVPTWRESPRSTDLKGFRFDRCTCPSSPRPWQHNEWLSPASASEWSPDPYEQLASCYQSSGDSDLARKAQISKNWASLRGAGPVRRVVGTALGCLVGFGYRKWPAGLLLVAAILVAGFGFWRLNEAGAMAPADPPEAASDCGRDYPCFNPLVYGADVVLPIIDFGQDGSWYPDSTARWGGLGEALRWTLIAVGWALASIFVVAFAGLVNRT